MKGQNQNSTGLEAEGSGDDRYLCVSAHIVDHVKPFPRQRRVKSPLVRPEVVVQQDKVRVDSRVLDAFGDRLVCRLAAPPLRQLVGLHLRLLLLRNLRLGQGNGRMGTCRHHGAWWSGSSRTRQQGSAKEV